MGVDAAIFAEKAKRYFYFDRAYNFGPNPPGMLTEEDVIRFARASIKQWRAVSGADHRIKWCEGVIEFAKTFSPDAFYVVTDSHEIPWFDVAHTKGFVEWTPPKRVLVPSDNPIE